MHHHPHPHTQKELAPGAVESGMFQGLGWSSRPELRLHAVLAWGVRAEAAPSALLTFWKSTCPGYTQEQQRVPAEAWG